MSSANQNQFKPIDVNFTLEPLAQFNFFLEYAKKNSVKEYDAMTLATVDAEGRPSARVLYMKELTDEGLVFYTNYQGQKSTDLMRNPKACVNFFWPEVFLQVRIFGTAQKITRQKSEAYFKTRPRISQIGAWASHQSQEMPNYDHLVSRFTEFEKEFEGQDVACPMDWGGFLIIPDEYEFWVGREGRLHERYCYRKSSAASAWERFMRSP